MRETICYIVGAGDFCAQPFAPQPGDYVIAADGGYKHLQERGVRIDKLIGDFDSLDHPPDHLDTIRLQKEKDETDMFYAIQYAMQMGYRVFHIYGGTGGRLSHTLANLDCLAYLSRRGARGYLFANNAIITAITNSRMEFDETHRGLISVFCHGDRATGVTIQGLQYPLSDATLTNDNPIGVSNCFTGKQSSVCVKNGTLLLIYESTSEEMKHNKLPALS